MFIILALIFSISVKMTAQDIYVVRQFGNNLSNWASGENTFSSVDNIERLCKPAFRVSDKIMQTLAKKNGWVLSKNYTLENYITCMQKEIDKGISINITDIQNVSLSEILNGKKEYSYVSCNIASPVLYK